MLLATLRYLLRSMLVDVESLWKTVLCFCLTFFLACIFRSGTLLLLVELRFICDRYCLPLDGATLGPRIPYFFTIFSTVILVDVLAIIDVIRKAL